MLDDLPTEARLARPRALVAPARHFEVQAIILVLLVHAGLEVVVLREVVLAPARLVGVVQRLARERGVGQIHRDLRLGVQVARAGVDVAPTLLAPPWRVLLLAHRVQPLVPRAARPTDLRRVRHKAALALAPLQPDVDRARDVVEADATAPRHPHLRHLLGPEVLASACRIREEDRFPPVARIRHVRGHLGGHRQVAIARVHVAPPLCAEAAALARPPSLLAVRVAVVVPSLTPRTQVRWILDQRAVAGGRVAEGDEGLAVDVVEADTRALRVAERLLVGEAAHPSLARPKRRVPDDRHHRRGVGG
mmetsp:Transcript_76111/g.210515  ORF Transcript_76111/g.210515 Transcript_76111/m.210515 type:complete len:306 (-) Transcript_76111:33-950(-)